MDTYFLYARKSTDEEDRQVLSIESQINELKEFAAKEKLEIVASLRSAIILYGIFGAKTN